MNLLENSRVLRLWIVPFVLFNFWLSYFLYSNFNNAITLFPAFTSIGWGILVYREANRLDLQSGKMKNS